jgi:hypothetical protein
MCLVIATEASSDVRMRAPWKTLDSPKALEMWGKLQDGARVNTNTHVDAVDFRVMLEVNLQLAFFSMKGRRRPWGDGSRVWLHQDKPSYHKHTHLVKNRRDVTCTSSRAANAYKHRAALFHVHSASAFPCTVDTPSKCMLSRLHASRMATASSCPCGRFGVHGRGYASAHMMYLLDRSRARCSSSETVEFALKYVDKSRRQWVQLNYTRGPGYGPASDIGLGCTA